MKKLILGACAVVCAASVLAQGTVTFNNRVTGTIVTKVYGANPADSTVIASGNGATDTPVGATDWSAYSPISGAGFTAEIWAASGADQPVGSLAAATPTTSFRTGAAAGFFAATTATLTGVALDAAAATLQVRVWDNRGGTITTWAQATADPSILSGASPLFNVNAIGGNLNTPPNLVGLVSFNVHNIVPEPTTFALAGLGAAALLIFRRRK